MCRSYEYQLEVFNEHSKLEMWGCAKELGKRNKRWLSYGLKSGCQPRSKEVRVGA